MLLVEAGHTYLHYCNTSIPFFSPVFITLSSPGNCRASEGSVTHRPPDKEGYFLSWWPHCDAAFGIRQLSAASIILEAEAQDPRVSVT